MGVASAYIQGLRGRLLSEVELLEKAQKLVEKYESEPDPVFPQKIEAEFKEEDEPKKKRAYHRHKKHAGGRPKKARIGRPPKEEKVKKHAGGRPKKKAEAPEDKPIDIDERFKKYEETYGCKPSCGSCEDIIPKSSLAVYMQGTFFHQACVQSEKEQ